LKIKILSQKYNPLLKRKEVIFEVNHSQEGQTTPRLELRKNLANMLKAKIDLVFVEKMETKTGTTTALGEANAYETAEQAKLVEREHIITRNILPEKAEEEAETWPHRRATELSEKYQGGKVRYGQRPKCDS
jgi:small subunit ribosomal protein S24e